MTFSSDWEAAKKQFDTEMDKRISQVEKIEKDFVKAAAKATLSGNLSKVKKLFDAAKKDVAALKVIKRKPTGMTKVFAVYDALLPKMDAMMAAGEDPNGPKWKAALAIMANTNKDLKAAQAIFQKQMMEFKTLNEKSFKYMSEVDSTKGDDKQEAFKKVWVDVTRVVVAHKGPGPERDLSEAVERITNALIKRIGEVRSYQMGVK